MLVRNMLSNLKTIITTTKPFEGIEEMLKGPEVERTGHQGGSAVEHLPLAQGMIPQY